MTISALVVCGNEEANIAACLESVRWCDEIVVIDSFSSDRTPEIARTFTDRVIQRTWHGFSDQKQFALEQAKGDWILNLDADERCTPELRDAIRAALPRAEAAGIAGFEVRRHVFYLGRWIDHGGWYPDWKLRVARRDRARFLAETLALGPLDEAALDEARLPARDRWSYRLIKPLLRFAPRPEAG